MTTSAGTLQAEGSRGPKTTTIETTLYDLIKAISEEVRAGEDHLIAEIVFRLIHTGKLKFNGIPREFNSLYS